MKALKSTKIGAFRPIAAQITQPKRAQTGANQRMCIFFFNDYMALDFFIHLLLTARKMPLFHPNPATRDGLYALTEDKQMRNRGPSDASFGLT